MDASIACLQGVSFTLLASDLQDFYEHLENLRSALDVTADRDNNVLVARTLGLLQKIRAGFVEAKSRLASSSPRDTPAPIQEETGPTGLKAEAVPPAEMPMATRLANIRKQLEQQFSTGMNKLEETAQEEYRQAEQLLRKKEGECRTLYDMHAELEHRVKELKEELDNVENDTAKERKVSKAVLDSARARVAQLEREVEEGKEAEAVTMNQLDAIVKQRDDLKDSLEDARVQRKQLFDDLAELKKKQIEADKKVAESTQRIEELERRNKLIAESHEKMELAAVSDRDAIHDYFSHRAPVYTPPEEVTQALAASLPGQQAKQTEETRVPPARSPAAERGTKRRKGQEEEK